MQTNFVCKCRQKVRGLQTKFVCKCRQTFADKLYQDTHTQNAEKLCLKCRRARRKIWETADKLCRQTLSTLDSGTPANWVGFVCKVCLQGLSARYGHADKVCLHAESLSSAFCKVVCSRNADKVCLRAESSSSAFCKVACSGNADKVCLHGTSLSVFLVFRLLSLMLRDSAYALNQFRPN